MIGLIIDPAGDTEAVDTGAVMESVDPIKRSKNSRCNTFYVNCLQHMFVILFTETIVLSLLLSKKFI